MNKGLKSYTKQLTQGIGTAKACVNINENDANMHIVLPLVKTLGNFPIALNLVYTHQNRNVVDTHFGKGFKLDGCPLVSFVGDDIIIQNADGSKDLYKNGVFNTETGLKVENRGGEIRIIDKTGNVTTYKLDGGTTVSNCMSMDFSAKNGGKITAVFGSYISNNKGDKIQFTQNSSGYITKAVYTFNGTTIATVNISYLSGKISTVEYRNQTGTVAKTSILYSTSNTVTVKNLITGEFLEFTFSGNKITSFKDMGGRTTAIAYNGKRTTVTDFLGNTSYVIFDDNNFPLYEIDNGFNIVRYEFDKNSKKLISISDPIQARNKDNSIFECSLRSFTREGIGLLETPFTDEIFNGVIGETVSTITGTGKLTKEINIDGLATDKLTCAVFGKLTGGSAKVELTTGNETVTADLKVSNQEYDMVTLGINAKKSYKKVKLTFIFENSAVLLGGVQVINKNLGTFYEYDSNGNMTKASGVSTTQISYNDNNMPTQSIGADSTVVGCVYDSKNNLTKALTANAVLIENEYDSENNPIKTTLTSNDGKILKSEMEYDETKRFIVKETDSQGNSTSMEYTEDGNLKKVTDALSAVTELSYNNNGLIEKLISKYGQMSAEAVYKYTSKNLLDTVTLTNGSKYGFVYDNLNRLKEVKLNDVTVFTYEYDETTGNILRQTYGSGDSYGFTYRADGLIESVTYKSAAAEGIKYYYGYDDQGRLTSVEDQEDIYCSNYTYDSEGRVKIADVCASQLTYGYDNLGNVNSLSADKDGIKVHQAFDGIQRSHYTHPELLFKSFMENNYCAFFETDANLKNTKEQFEPLNCSVKIERDGRLSLARLDKESALRYGFRVDPQDYSNDAGCIMFWFKMDNINQKCSLCGVSKELSGNNSIAAYIENKKITVNVRDNNDIVKCAFTSTYEIKEGWNFFALSYKNRNDGPGYSNEFSCSMTLNKCTQTNCLGSINMNFGQRPIYKVSLVKQPYIDDYLNGYVAALMATPRKYAEQDEINNYYSCSKDFIADNQLIDKNAETVDFGQSSVYTVNKNILDKFEIYPLRNNLLSLNGKKPIAFDLRNTASGSIDKTFNFNQKIKGYAYVADGELLQYDFGQCTSGTIMMRAYTEEFKNSQYLFDCIDENNKHIALFLDEHGFVNALCGKLLSITSMRFTPGEWHTVGISFANENSVYDSSGVLNIRIFLDGKESVDQLNAVEFGTLKLTVGKMANHSDTALNGQIEMLAVNNVFNELSTIQTLANELSVYSKSTEYDELGLLKKTDIHKDGNSILSHTYLPYGGDKIISEKILAENIKYGDTEICRAYDYDDCGRIIHFEQTEELNYTSYDLKYDYRGFLTKFNDETFEYDKNGNITKYNGTVFGYDSVIKDKLISVGGTAINYVNAASLNPTSWGSKRFVYEGRRLVSYYIYRSRFKHKYEYDEQCHRIRKTYKDTVTNYTYSGDKLVIEDGPKGKLFFLYDENGQLYGFVKDEKKYFYIKDITGTIYGIVDESGTLVGKYEYSAYGKCTILVDTDGIATLNPFRFKCYYYDTESGMYYCQTRYFVPEWGRWLNADNPNFLQFDNINGMNLFAYCNNSPVMYADPSGEILLSLLFAAISGAFISGLASTLVQLATTGEVKWSQVGVSALFGAVSGALSFWGIGGALGQFAIQGALGVGELYSIAGLNGTASKIGAAEFVGTFLFAGALGAIGGRGGRKNFNRIVQIERDFMHYAGRDIIRYGKSLIKAIGNWSGKYLKEFIKPTFFNSLTTGGITAVANIADFWIQKLYDEFK